MPIAFLSNFGLGNVLQTTIVAKLGEVTDIVATYIHLFTMSACIITIKFMG